MNIYVGNLSYEVTEGDLQAAFGTFGQVGSATVIKDAYSGRSRGFGFVEMPDAGEAAAAINGINNTDLKGRTVKVSEARPRPQSGGRRTGGGPGGSRGRGGPPRDRGRY